MARIRSVDFLPEIFKTTTNKKFLGSTLDQLIQEPKLKVTQGYIGRRSGAGVGVNDTYLIEPTVSRENYQLEPGIIFNDKNGVAVDALTYPGLVDGLNVRGALVNNHNRLFEAETYSWDPLFNFDKFVNYSQYYWLPEGPSSVNVQAEEVLLEDEFDVSRNDGDSSYTFSGKAGQNPILTLVRGGTYTFNVGQTGHPFWIQTEPGLTGHVSWAENISSREILGVVNNGDDNGTITFNVPLSNGQDFYDTLLDLGPVDLATMVKFNEINRKPLDEIVSINEIENLENKTIVFVNPTVGDATTLGWVIEALPNYADYSNSGDFSTTTVLTSLSERYQIFKIFIVYDNWGENPIINLVPIQTVNQFEKFTIQYGPVYSNIGFYKNSSGVFEQIPRITAPLDQLFYQDGNNEDIFGVINLVDANESATLFISDIIGNDSYTSPNGVEFTNGLKVKFRGDVVPAEYTNEEYYVEGVGTSIKLLPVRDFITPEPYTKNASDPFDSLPYDSIAYDGSLNSPLEEDYLTINRASQDLNAWTRSNRWFHIDVLQKSADYNNVTLVVDQTSRAKRPIIEFESNLQLFNFGAVAKTPVNVIDTKEVDALSNVHGSLGYAVDGFILSEGSRIIFAADTDPNVKNKIFNVSFEDLDNSGTETLVLTLAEDGNVVEDDVVLVTSGLTQQGKTYHFSNNQWVLAQQKNSVNQPPLFDIFDNDNISFSDISKYQASTFKGSKLFSYAIGNGSNDIVLGFPLQYLNIGNLGDIVFENNLYIDTFLYVENSVSQELPISSGFVKQFSSATEYNWRIGWTRSAERMYVPQVFNFTYTGAPLQLDVTPRTDLEVPSIKIFVNNSFVPSTDYAVTTHDRGTTIAFNEIVATDSKVEVLIYSDEVSDIGYYEVPRNLSQNIFNENTDRLTLGTIRNHYNSLAQNILNLVGNINGANNIRDLGNVSSYGDIIIQHAAPLALAAKFIRTREYDLFEAIKFNGRYYEKYKNQLLDWVQKNDIADLSIDEILEHAVANITAGKTLDHAFYNSDMLPAGNDYDVVTHQITAISTDTFDIINVYDFTKANSKAILVYLNDTLLVKDHDYIVADDGPRITLLIDSNIDDILTIKEYRDTAGSMLPATPTKLGLYPKYLPEKFVDNTFITPTEVIRGHDGSITVAFGDLRDDVLLEFERRIYNNIKVNDNIPLLSDDVIPGQYRNTGYSDIEITEILSPSFLSWVGWNRLDYREQDYRANDSRTWNYSSSSSVIDDSLLKGHWRGVFKYFYDTDAPHTRPWEMLGLTEEPSWWENQYGPAPYTSGNLVLWDDLEAGIIRDPNGEYIDERYIRPGLTDIIPVDGEGNLLTPMETVVKTYSSYNFKKSWRIGDLAPVEAAWRRSSLWPFAVQRLLALTKPAQYFALMADRDRYTYNEELQQYLLDGRYRLDSRAIEVLTSDTPKHSYINWIIEYNKHYGYNSADELVESLSNLDVNLCYRMGSFTDKNRLKIFTDKSSPDSTNNSLLLPDESYNLLLYRNQPFDEIIYSSVIVQRVEDGYSVFGNSTTDPYFKIMQSIPNGNFKTFQIGRTTKSATTIRVPQDFRDSVVYIPYGYVFSNKHQVVDFLVSYGEYLSRVGVKFNNSQDTVDLDWTQMAKEFIYWVDQGWSIGSVINLNPTAESLEFERELAIVDSLLNLAVNEQPLDQNNIPLAPADYVIDRLENNFKLTTLNDRILSYLNLQLTSFEHLLILDNTSIFNDVIYSPVTGVRQNRVKLVGYTVNEWNGQLDAQGFLFSDNKIDEWVYTKSYSKGSIVKFKNSYWTAIKPINPSEMFDYDAWVKIEPSDISTGLLSNLATKSDQMLQFYNNKTANLESDADLLALGLTGFRPREYMSSLDLDDISQVNIYSDLIKQKGTLDSLGMFKNITLNGNKTEYKIFENWAIRRAQYGATASRAYFELQLDEAQHNANPTSIAIVNGPTEVTDADQKVTLNQIYKQSVKHTSKDILPLLTEKVTDVSLPYAGFVDFEDVDFYTFSLDTFETIDANLSDIIDSTLIWVAKDTDYDWNVYRVTAISPPVVRVQDNLNGTLTIEFAAPHQLTANTVIIIKYFDSQIDGTYRVNGIVNEKKVQVNGSLLEDQTVIEDEVGSAFKLVSVRVDYPSSIVDSPFDKQLFADDRIWVNNDGGLARVYEKERAFTSVGSLESTVSSSESDFGSAIAQGRNNTGAIVGDVLNNGSKGILYCYNKATASEYILHSLLDLSHLPVNHLGKTLAMATNVAAVAADGMVAIINRNVAKDVFEFTQILPEYPSGFGQAITISADERWLFITEYEQFSDDPYLTLDTQRLHIYQQIKYQDQEVTYTATGTQTQFELEGYVVIGTTASANNQVTVTVNGNKVTNYVVNGPTIQFTSAPPAGAIVNIRRNDIQTFESDGSTTTFTVNGLHAINGIESISVYVENKILRPNEDYTFSGIDLELLVAPPAGDAITVRTGNYYVEVSEIDFNVDDAQYGLSIDVGEDAQQIVVGAPGLSEHGPSSTTVNNVGRVILYNRAVERFVATIDGQAGVTTLRTPKATSQVWVNGVPLEPAQFNKNPQYTISGNIITLTGVEIKAGDFIDVDINDFIDYQTLDINVPREDALFGSAVSLCRSECALYVGAPGDIISGKKDAGSVTRFVNMSRMTGVLVGTNQNPTVTVGDSIRVNNVEVIFTNTNVEQVATDINNTLIPNVRAYVSDGYLVIELKNKEVASLANRLKVTPGRSAINNDIEAFNNLGLAPYQYTQTITAPDPESFGRFGNAVQIDYNMNQLYVAAENMSAKKIAIFDNRETTFDGRTLRFVDIYDRSGVVYTYDVLRDETRFTPGKLAYGEQVYDFKLQNSNGFGQRISVVDGLMMVGSPGYDEPTVDAGRVALFYNFKRKLTWTDIKVEQPRTDVTLINSAFIYDYTTSQVKQYLDYIDPLNGKILGPAAQNLDYIRGDDPAQYMASTEGPLWGEAQVGQMWWDTSTVRFLDYFQDDIKRGLKRWGKTFPGSSIDVYEWVESSLPPARYTGEGEVYDLNKYVSVTLVNEQRIIESKHYFWVKGISQVNKNAYKTLGAEAVATYIETPSASGLPYLALINASTIGMFNMTSEIDVKNVILHVEYDKVRNDSKVFVEFDLLREGDERDTLSPSVYKKMLDSFCGVDSLGNAVPDINLTITDRYGIDFRPRKSMFVDRFAALSMYIQKVNGIIAQYPVAESKVYPLLNSKEEPPAANTGAWDLRVADNAELSYQNFNIVPAGYKYLVEIDSNNNGLWSIYEVQANKTLQLIVVQSYDTRQFWNYINWYADDFNPLTKPDIVVDTYAQLLTIVKEEGRVARVNLNANGNWEIYRCQNNIWERVGLQNGTIAFSTQLYDYSLGRFGFDNEVFDAQYFDQEPVIELRNILRSINEEILVGDLALERNNVLIAVFKYILSEQQNVDWLYKTSLIDVSHKVRTLDSFSVYQKENQNYVIDYINEAKPYHTKIKEFRLGYDGFDQYNGLVTDFDCPSYYDSEFDQFISPILDDGAILVTDPSNKAPTDPIWGEFPWSSWYSNYKLQISVIEVLDGGAGYTIPPQVKIVGDCEEPAILEARVSGSGQITEVRVITPGCGYLDTPVITFIGGNGSGASAKAVMRNDLVRSFTLTIKYDRYEYTSSVLNWEDTVTRNIDDLIRFNNTVYRVKESNNDLTFVSSKYEEVNIEELSGIDRTVGYYVPDVNKPGLDLSLLVDGIVFPGVQVDGPGFNLSSGFDVQFWDTDLFDSIVYGPEGYPTYPASAIDTIYESSFLDGYLGTRATDINVDGGEFIDVYHSHAPEELVPGSMFDTLSISVYSRPGADWLNDGHSYAYLAETFNVTTVPAMVSFANIAEYPITVFVVNATTKRTLYETIDFTVDWINQTVLITDDIAINDNVKVFISEIGGGDQLHREIIFGNEVVNDRYEIPVNASEIKEVIVFANGVRLQNITVEAIDSYSSNVVFSDTLTANEFVTITVFGISSPYDENYLQTFTFVAGAENISVYNNAFFNEDFFSGGSTQLLNDYILPPGQLSGMNKMNAVVELNGFRLRPPEALRHYAASTQTVFTLPVTGDIPQMSIANNEVHVFVNDELQTEGIDYTLSATTDLAVYNSAFFNNAFFSSPDSTPARFVTFFVPPGADTKVDVYVTTAAEYSWLGDEVIIHVPTAIDDIVGVTVYGDTRELDLLTEVFVGPTVLEEEEIDLFGDRFDYVPFDYETGINIAYNVFNLSKQGVTNPERLWVTLNGQRLAANDDYIIDVSGNLILTMPLLADTDVLAITSMTDSVVTNGVAFRIFKDMRDNYAAYSLSESHVTYLTQPLAVDDDVIYVHDASVIAAPNLTQNRFGIVIIDGERITFRVRDLGTNTLSGLRRGTAGTGAAAHDIGADVSDASSKAIIPGTFSSGRAYTYLTQDWNTSDDVIYVHDATEAGLNVYDVVGFGTVTIDGLDGYHVRFTSRDPITNTISGLTIVANDAGITPAIPATIGKSAKVYDVGREKVWYAQGAVTASNGIPLQEQNTPAAQFIRN
jgi:hypothetical protein